MACVSENYRLFLGFHIRGGCSRDRRQGVNLRRDEPVHCEIEESSLKPEEP
jgi:hypothetical protein